MLMGIDERRRRTAFGLGSVGTVLVAASVAPGWDLRVPAALGGAALVSLAVLVWLRPAMSRIPANSGASERPLPKVADRSPLAVLPIRSWEWAMCAVAVLCSIPIVWAIASSTLSKSLGLGALGAAAALVGGLGLRGGYNPADRVLYLLGVIVLAAFVVAAALRPLV